MAEKKHLVLDGGFATEVAWTHGHQYIDHDPLWSARLLATDPDVLKKVNLSFLESGADIAATSSYQASIDGFMKHLSLSRDEAHQLIVKSGQLSREAVDSFWAEESNRTDQEKPLVAGSIGPYGACQHDLSEYTGNYVDTMSLQDLETWHLQQIRALLDSPVDMLAFETIPALKEAEAIVNVLRQFPNTTAWISFSCKDTQHICHGEKYEDALKVVARSDNVVGVGMNCLPPDNVTPLLARIPQDIKQRKNIIVYPNSGETWSDDRKWVGEECCTPLYSYVPQWLDGGATWIGGCCRVKPAAISQIRESMQSHLKT